MAISNVFLKKNVCLSVCLPFFQSADARDLGLMTLFSANFSFQFRLIQEITTGWNWHVLIFIFHLVMYRGHMVSCLCIYINMDILRGLPIDSLGPISECSYIFYQSRSDIWLLIYFLPLQAKSDIWLPKCLLSAHRFPISLALLHALGVSNFLSHFKQ